MINWFPGMTLELLEKAAILQAFRFYRGNKTTTASALGIAIRTLDNKLEKFQADGEEQERITNDERTRREEFLQRQRGILPATTQAAGGTVLHGADAGLPVEPALEASPKPTVSVPERKEVQGLLSIQTSKGRTGRHR